MTERMHQQQDQNKQQQHPNGHHQGNGHDAATAKLLETELLVLAQVREIRERTAELLGPLNAYVGYELGRRLWPL